MVKIHHIERRIRPEPSRVLMRPFHIAVEPRDLNPTQTSRAERIVNGVRALSAREVQAEIALVTSEFEARHPNILGWFRERWREVAAMLALDEGAFTPHERALIGAYFSHEYSYGSAAIMNPSVVAHPDQSGLAEGTVRFVMSMRTVGEGHISSIAFREGTLSADGTLDLATPPPVSFSPSETVEGGDVRLSFSREAPLSATVIFPVTEQQRNGLEDLRLVAFEDGGETTFYGTYTAYSGRSIASEMLVTRDFNDFELCAMTGSATDAKGLALFPRRVGGRYAAIGRQDSESLFFITTDDPLRWDGGERIAGPLHPWELVQIGNCGSPIEIDEGWLLLTHGVGAVRKYAIGAMLLDKDDPSRVIGRSVQPILSPEDEDREGYVPNVVYTCGAMAVGRRLFLPYGVADSSLAFAWVDLDGLVASLA